MRKNRFKLIKSIDRDKAIAIFDEGIAWRNIMCKYRDK